MIALDNNEKQILLAFINSPEFTDSLRRSDKILNIKELIAVFINEEVANKIIVDKLKPGQIIPRS